MIILCWARVPAHPFVPPPIAMAPAKSAFTISVSSHLVWSDHPNIQSIFSISILYRTTFAFSKKGEDIFSFPFWAHQDDSEQSMGFLNLHFKTFQPLTITQFQNHFHIFRLLLSDMLLLSTKIYFSSGCYNKIP